MYFYLVPTNETLRLANDEPDLGRRWSDGQPAPRRTKRDRLPSALPLTLFSDSDWRPLQHVVLHALAAHAQRSATVAEAAFCIVAAPAQNGLYPQGHRERRDFHDRGGCGTVGSFWRTLCPATKPLLVIDTVDADYRSFKLCKALWDRRRSARSERRDRSRRGQPSADGTSWRAETAATFAAGAVSLAHSALAVACPRANRTTAGVGALCAHRRRVLDLPAWYGDQARLGRLAA